MDLPLVALGVVGALSAAVLFSGSGRSREVAGRWLMTTGFNCLGLPIAVLIAFVGSAGAQLPAGNVVTVGLSVGGLLAGILLVFLGDRLLRQVARMHGTSGGGTVSLHGSPGLARRPGEFLKFPSRARARFG